MTATASPMTLERADDAAPIRTLVVDDSVVVRTLIDRMLGGDDGFTILHKTGTAQQAIAYLTDHDVDLVLLDIEMPGQSGLAALPDMLAANPDTKVVILSGRCDVGSAAAVEALALGASDILSKPTGGFTDAFCEALIERLNRLFTHGSPLPQPVAPVVRDAAKPAAAPIACLGIGASTGGIHALAQLLQGMKAPLGVPILLTQHLPLSFTHYFAQQLARMTTLPVKVAVTGEVLAPDVIYVAPGDANLRLRHALHGRVAIALSPERTPTGNLPGVDPMFASMAAIYGPGAAGIVLTGMGRDGLEGAREIVAAGGWIVAQDEASSVVWGMPGSVVGAGLTCNILEPLAMMDYVAQRGLVTA